MYVCIVTGSFVKYPVSRMTCQMTLPTRVEKY